MKTLVIISLVLCLAAPAFAQVQLYARDGTYLGNATNNPYDPNSVNNPYGRYGSQYSSDSINNKYGKYGSPYSSQSPDNIYYNDETGISPPPFGPDEDD
ncbi:MAG: hypothetical protein WC593_15115 [Methanoregula sp.]